MSCSWSVMMSRNYFFAGELSRTCPSVLEDFSRYSRWRQIGVLHHDLFETSTPRWWISLICLDQNLSIVQNISLSIWSHTFVRSYGFRYLWFWFGGFVLFSSSSLLVAADSGIELVVSLVVLLCCSGICTEIVLCSYLSTTNYVLFVIDKVSRH